MSERFVAKFSWSRPAALRLAREIGVLTALVRVPPVPLLPGAVASSTPTPAADHQACAGESLFQVIDSIDRDRTGRLPAFVLAALHQSTAANVPRPPSASSPARSAADHDQIPCATGSGAVRPDQRQALRAGASGRRRAGLCPTETLRPPLPGQQAAAQHSPHVLARTRRQPCIAAANRASACSRQCDPARLGTAVSLTRRCLHLRPTADQGTARVNGQGKRPGM
jgi:hypothetical protein